MIARLTGRIVTLQSDQLVLDVGNLGYLVLCSERTMTELQDVSEVTLHTHYVIRQDTPTLFGFMTEEEKAIFLLLLTVPRVGPKVALSILGTLDIDQLSTAIANEDSRALAIVSGVSTKMAQKIVVELRDKFPQAGITPRSGTLALDSEVVDALVALGYGVVEAQRTVQSIPRDAPEDVGERLRIALGRMGMVE